MLEVTTKKQEQRDKNQDLENLEDEIPQARERKKNQDIPPN